MPFVHKPFNEKGMSFAVRGVLTHSQALMVVIPTSPHYVTGYPAWLPMVAKFTKVTSVMSFCLAMTLWRRYYYSPLPFNR